MPSVEKTTKLLSIFESCLLFACLVEILEVSTPCDQYSIHLELGLMLYDSSEAMEEVA